MSRNFPENATASKPGRPGISTMATCRSCAAEAAANNIETAKHANIRERRMEPPGSSNSTLGCRQQQNCCLKKQLSVPHICLSLADVGLFNRSRPRDEHCGAAAASKPIQRN